jgi:hypothetical protein
MTLHRGNTSICNIKGHFDYTFTDVLKIKREKMTNLGMSAHGLKVPLSYAAVSGRDQRDRHEV